MPFSGMDLWLTVSSVPPCKSVQCLRASKKNVPSIKRLQLGKCQIYITNLLNQLFYEEWSSKL